MAPFSFSIYYDASCWMDWDAIEQVAWKQHDVHAPADSGPALSGALKQHDVHMHHGEVIGRGLY